MKHPPLPWFLQAVGGLETAVSRFSGETARPYLVFDLETTNLDKGWAGNPLNHIVCASWSVNGGPVTSCYGDEFHQHELSNHIDDMIREQGVIVAHGAKFEAGWLKRLGFDPASVLWWDTLLGEYVQAGNRRWPLNLDETAQRYGCEEKDPLIQSQMDNGVCPSQMDERGLLARNRKDTTDTLLIFQTQQEQMTPAQIKVLFTRGLSVPVLADVEMQGVAVDSYEVDKAIRMAEEELRTYLMEWEEFERKHISQYSRPNWLEKGISLTSGDHVAWVLYYALGVEELRNARGDKLRNKATKRWPTGKPLANDKAIAKLKLTTPEQREFVRLRKNIARVRAELSKTLYFFKGVCELHGGVFFGQFNQSVTQTHRLSSSGRKLLMPDGKHRGIQLQNMPRKFLKLMRAKRGVLASHDAAQLEFRTAVELGDDSAGRRNIAEGVDQHRHTASVLLNKPTDLVSDEERQNAKSETFKPLYGGRKGTEAQMRYYEAFRTWFPGIAATQEGWTEEVLLTGKLELPWGMTFYWPGTKISKDGYIDNTPSIYNYPIQSLATAEIVPVAVVYLYHRMRAALPEARLVNMVHDSAVAEIPDSTHADAWLYLGRQAFGNDVYDYLKLVYGLNWATPLGLGTKFGVNKEIKTELPVDNPYRAVSY